MWATEARMAEVAAYVATIAVDVPAVNLKVLLILPKVPPDGLALWAFLAKPLDALFQALPVGSNIRPVLTGVDPILPKVLPIGVDVVLAEIAPIVVYVAAVTLKVCSIPREIAPDCLASRVAPAEFFDALLKPLPITSNVAPVVAGIGNILADVLTVVLNIAALGRRGPGRRLGPGADRK